MSSDGTGECAILVPDASVSRRHARVTLAEGQLTLEDLESVNGVFVNQGRVKTTQLADGDALRVGSVRFEVRLSASSPRFRLSRRLKATLRGVFSPGRSGEPWSRAARDHLRSGGTWLRGAFARLWSDRSWQIRAGAGLAVAGLVGGGTVFGLLSVDRAVPGAPPQLRTGGAQWASVTASAAPGAGAPAPDDVILPVLARTATAPFSRSGPNGMPRDLPPVDARLDFDGFVARALARARACDDGEDFACLRHETEKLLARDPINATAKALHRKVEAFEMTERALARAARLVARREYGAAYRLLAAIPADAPQASAAQTRKAKIRKLAVDDELQRAAEESRRPGTYKKAHDRYRTVLRMAGDSPVALDGLRTLERRMRRSKMRFVAYRPPHADEGGPRTLDEVEEAIRTFYDGNAALARDRSGVRPGRPRPGRAQRPNAVRAG